MIADAFKLVATAAPVPTGANLYYSHNDHLGTPQVFINQNQTVVWQTDYQPFGEVSESVTIFANNLRFAGQYFDGESGLHYNYFRDYDPGTGRYVQSDPIGIDGGLNTYGYVSQNPIKHIDLFALLRSGRNKNSGCGSPRQNCLNAYTFFGWASLGGGVGTFAVKSTAAFVTRKIFGFLGSATFVGPAFCYNLSDELPCDDDEGCKK